MRKNFLLILTFVLMVLGLFGTWGQGGNGPDISFLKCPWITGPSDVYTKYTNQEGGVRWSPSKSDMTVVIQSEARGFGDVTSTLTNCNGVYWTYYPGAIGDHVTSFTCRCPGYRTYVLLLLS